MLSNGGFTQPCNSRNCLTTTVSGGAASFSTSLVNKPHLFLVPKPSSSSSIRCKTGSFSSHSRQFEQTHLRFCAVRGERRGGFCVFAQKKGKGSAGEVDVEDFGDEEEDLDDFEDEEEDFDDGEDEEDDEDDVVLPIEKMKKWLVKKPIGFGVGKAYDTSVEEKLIEEREQSRRAQAINIRNLKLNPVNPNSKKGDKKKEKEETGAIPSGISVRVSNLPKKKNIHRDLVSAFKGFEGIVNINPVVSGTKKTRDPVCKGYGFIDFKSEKDASRFIEVFSKQTIVFGKVQKQVKYELLNSHSSNVAREKSSNAPGGRLAVLEKTEDVEKFSGQYKSEDIEDDELVMAEMEDSEDDEIVGAEMEDSEDDELVIAEIEDSEDDEFLKEEAEDARDDYIEPILKSSADLSSSKKPLKLKAAKEMEIVNGRGEKAPNVEGKKPLKLKAAKEMEVADGRGKKAPNVEEKKPLKLKAAKEMEIVDGTGEKAPNVEDSNSEEARRERIKLLEQRLVARMKGEKIPKLEIEGSAKWLKIKEEMGQLNVSKQQDKPKPKEKKQNSKPKGGQAHKSVVPGSAKRLKVKEKAILTGVLMKYGAKRGLASKGEK